MTDDEDDLDVRTETIGDVLKKDRDKSARKRRVCVKRLMNVDVAKKCVGSLQNRDRYSVLTLHPVGSRREFMYVSMCGKLQ